MSETGQTTGNVQKHSRDQ